MWNSAPRWVAGLHDSIRGLHRKLDAILLGEGIIMSAAQDLANVVSSMGSAIVNLDAAVQAKLAAIPTDDPVVAQAVSDLSAMVNKVAVDAAALATNTPAAPNVTAPPAPPADAQPVTPSPDAAAAVVVAPVEVTAPNAVPPAV